MNKSGYRCLAVLLCVLLALAVADATGQLVSGLSWLGYTAGGVLAGGVLLGLLRALARSNETPKQKRIRNSGYSQVCKQIKNHPSVQAAVDYLMGISDCPDEKRLSLREELVVSCTGMALGCQTSMLDADTITMPRLSLHIEGGPTCCELLSHACQLARVSSKAFQADEFHVYVREDTVTLVRPGKEKVWLRGQPTA